MTRAPLLLGLLLGLLALAACGDSPSSFKPYMYGSMSGGAAVGSDSGRSR